MLLDLNCEAPLPGPYESWRYRTYPFLFLNYELQCYRNESGNGLKVSFFCLIYTEAPQYSLRQHNVTIADGSESTLWCPVHGSPAPQIVWLKDGQLLQNSTSVMYKLYAWQAKEEPYFCSAKNSFGSTKFIALLVIKQSKLESLLAVFKLYVYSFLFGTNLGKTMQLSSLI